MVEPEREKKEETQTFRLSKKNIDGLIRDIIIIHEIREWKEGDLQHKEESIDLGYRFSGKKHERFGYMVYDDDFKNVREKYPYLGLGALSNKQIDDRVISLIKKEIPAEAIKVLSLSYII